MTETKLYRLYASYDKNIPDGVEYSLQPFGANYLLCFTDKELEKPFRVIPSTTPLTSQENAWLMNCKMAVNAKYMRANEAEISDGLDMLLSAVEKELAEEQNKLKREKKGS